MHKNSQKRPVALVTGAAKRIGRHLALSLAREGFDLALHYHTSQDEAKSLVSAVHELGGRAVALPADLADLSQVASLIARAGEALGPVTLLVNSAAVFEQDSLADLSLTRFRRQLAINLEAPLFLAQAFYQALGEDESGQIVNLLDQRIAHPDASFLSYTLSKCALASMTEMLARTLAPRVRVNAIAPGPVLPNPYQAEADFLVEAKSTPLGRPVAMDDLAQALGLLLKAPSVTGQILMLAAGQNLTYSPEAL